MLVDLAYLVHDYIGCKDCYYGYDSYDQEQVRVIMSTMEEISDPATTPPRFCRCRQVRVYAGPLPRGTINCITLTGKTNEKTKIHISSHGNLLFNIIGYRTMVFIDGGDLNVENYDGIIIAHYVNYTMEVGKYRICVKNICLSRRYKYMILNKNVFNLSEKKLQKMWNYIYPGRRPRSKYLVHFTPAKYYYYRYPLLFEYEISYDTTIEKCVYNELAAIDGGNNRFAYMLHYV